MENFMETASLCALNKIFGFEPKTAFALISHLGSAEAIFKLSSSELDLLLGPYSKHKGQIRPHALEQAIEELEKLRKNGISFCGWTEDDYPPLLKECDDPPIGLYIRTHTPIKELWKGLAVAIVGTRDISPYGREWCRRIVQNLSQTKQKPVIISGLALGTDIEAHRAAIEVGLPTIGVMATGPDSIYPLRHRGFAEEMADSPGCALITDYPPGTPPLAINFIRRNRIIAGLSKATLLIESKIQGGGMMTCRLANSYNRDVYALPGRIDDIRSQGCNELIRKNIAEPVTSAETFIRSLGMKPAHPPGRTDFHSVLSAHYGGQFSRENIDKMHEVLAAIKKERGITIGELPEVTGLDYRSIAEIIGILETDGFISCDLLQRCRIRTDY